MRFYKISQIILSEDAADPPKCQKFSTVDNLTDLTSLINEVSSTQTYAPAAHAIGFGEIAEVRWFYLKADKEVTVELNGGPAITLFADKPIEMWAKITSLTINTSDVSGTRMALAIAGT
jgi:hypothetical protein